MQFSDDRHSRKREMQTSSLPTKVPSKAMASDKHAPQKLETASVYSILKDLISYCRWQSRFSINPTAKNRNRNYSWYFWHSWKFLSEHSLIVKVSRHFGTHLKDPCSDINYRTYSICWEKVE